MRKLARTAHWLPGLIALAIGLPVTTGAVYASSPPRVFTHFESFENAVENTASDPRDINGNGIIDCGRDNDCGTVTSCTESPDLCDEWTLPLVADPNLKLANEATPATQPNLVYFKTNEAIFPSSRGTAAIVGAGSTNICPADQDNGATVGGVRADSMDWHVHTVNTPDIDGTDTSGPGTMPKAFRGQNSLHWGRHVELVDPRPGQRRGQRRVRTFGDTYCLQCVNAFVLDRPGGLNLASRPTREQPLRLSFWHIAEYCDDECFAGFADDVADEIAIVEARSAPTGSDAFGIWERIQPDVNPYDGVQDTAYFTPTYEPEDDVNPNPPAGVDPATTMCAPLTVYVAQGSAKGTDPGCGDGDGNGFGDCGNVSSGTALGESGVGVWARTSTDLSRYAGRRVQIRFISTTLDGRDVFTSYLETDSGPFLDPAVSVDDGWYVDDVRVSGLVQ